MKERLKETFRELSALIGVAGHEQEVVRYLRDKFTPLADEVKIDPNGNFYAVKKGSSPGAKLMICAHSDEIGFSVKNILANGFLTFEKLGTQSERGLEGRKVWLGQNISGVIGIMPGHLQSVEDRKKVVKISDCYIDVGVSSIDEAKALGIEIGMPVAFQSDFLELNNPDLICTKSVDNRINCAIILELFRELQNTPFAGTLYGAVSVQEELGLRGAFMLGNQIKPDYAVVTDTIPASDTPDVAGAKLNPVRLGGGPACSLSDGIPLEFRYTIPSAKLIKLVKEVSRKTDVEVQYINMIGAGYLTDANNLNLAAEGIPLVSLAIPRRYSHSPVEVVNLNDALGSLKILKEIVLRNAEVDLSFI